MEKLLN